VLVLAESGRQAASGEIDELVVRSSFLSPGYWRRPELTAAAFEERPDEPGVRRYRTGDLGRMAPDGCIEYLGRRDAQVKVRGERVEIEAVESALVASGLVREAAATTRAGGGGEPSLVAFVVPDTGVEPAPGELRRRLAASLPPASVPSQFRFVAGLPLTEHGKLDRAALGTLDGRPVRAGPAPVEARDPLEQQLVELWRETLGVERIGVHDEFLALGGDSLAAATLLARLEQLYDLELPGSLLAANGTIDALAAAIGTLAAPASSSWRRSARREVTECRSSSHTAIPSAAASTAASLPRPLCGSARSTASRRRCPSSACPASRSSRSVVSRRSSGRFRPART
jgi:acyl carrier protein